MSEMTHVAKPYAQAFFEVAVENSTVAIGANHLDLLAQIIKTPEMQTLLNAPQVKSDQVVDLLIEIFTRSYQNTHIVNLIKSLGEYRRFDAIPEIAFQFHKLKAEHENVQTVTVSTVYELSNDYYKQLQQKLKQTFGAQIKIETRIDPSLIGGIVVQAGDHIIDGSIKTYLGRLKETLVN